jgi:hypothetical protein
VAADVERTEFCTMAVAGPPEFEGWLQHFCSLGLLRRTVAGFLGDTIAHTLIDDGAASYELDWGGPPRLIDGTGEPLDPWTPAYEALTADDDLVAALEAWLDHHGVAQRPVLSHDAPYRQ